jgi:hypothetical protein
MAVAFVLSEIRLLELTGDVAMVQRRPLLMDLIEIIKFSHIACLPDGKFP